MDRKIIHIYLFLSLIVNFSSAFVKQSYESKIQEKIFGPLPKLSSFPSNNSIEIHLGFKIIGIKDMETLKGIIQLAGIFILQWKDPSLVWDPKNFGNKKYLNYETIGKDSKIWLPDIILIQSAENPLQQLLKTKVILIF